ncbi:MAG: 3-dehydroquinate synthase, partial [Muribaculaceae bacterium]|nr:3-dehydroquinate synthase [Muribaculaceae bacterium]
MDNQIIIETDNIQQALMEAVENIPHDRLFLLSDSNVERDVFPLIKEFLEKINPVRIILPSGEEYKNIRSLEIVWEALGDAGASRKSLLINLGGGVITDLGGFAAACFKRGIKFVNVPTTLLAAVDAAVGGKTGIDFNGLKNEIGAFAPANSVILSKEPFKTLPFSQLASGFAETVKMAMITSRQDYRDILLESETNDLDLTDPKFPIARLMSMAVREKARIVKEDPHEAGLRKILNFGHTCGHAFETLLLQKGTPVPHGTAIAHGILVALILSHIRLKADSILIHQYRNKILVPLFPKLNISCHDTDTLLELISHDKKNSDGKITFILLSEIASPVISLDPPLPAIRAAIELYHDLMSCPAPPALSAGRHSRAAGSARS